MILTVGHSTHQIKRFIELLAQNGVNAVADVRSSPYSRFNPQFNRESLKTSLAEHGIRYVFLGKELGVRSKDSEHYQGNRVVYDRLAASALFKEGLARLINGAKEHCIAIMCAEKDPLECHRAILVSRELDKVGISVGHILEDGTVEAHSNAESRLLKRIGGNNDDFFKSREQIVEDAYRIQGERIAYIEQNADEEPVDQLVKI